MRDEPRRRSLELAARPDHLTPAHAGGASAQWKAAYVTVEASLQREAELAETGDYATPSIASPAMTTTTPTI
jgi:hypothetical protein